MFGLIYSLNRVGVLRISDTVLQVPRCSFDAHMRDIFGTMLLGSTLVMLRPHGTINLPYLADTVKAKEIMNIGTVPTILTAFIEYLTHNSRSDVLQTLRSLCSGGKFSIHASN